MKTDRRSFFQLGVGAAVAGPQVVSDVAKKIVESPGGQGLVNGGYYVGGLNKACSTEAEPDLGYWRDVLKSSTAELKRLSVEARPKHERNWQPVAAQHIDCLRSVAPSHKARMMCDEIEEVRRMSERTWLESRIAEAKKMLGPLGELF